MASFRSGVKIISDVSKLQGRALPHNYVSPERLLVIRGNRSSSSSQSKSSLGQELSDMTRLVADESTSWFAPFMSRQGRREPRPQPAAPQGRRFLAPLKGPQSPNRYFSAKHCKKDEEEEAPKPCFQDSFKPKVDLETKEEESSVYCGGKKKVASRSGGYCASRNKSAITPFTLCPKPIVNPPIYKCPVPPPKEKEKKIVVHVDKCDEHKPPPFKICPRPPPRKMKPMCLVLSGKLDNKPPAATPPRPPPTPRRCLCEGDPEFIILNKPVPLYKMNPEIPFKVCPKRTSFGRETYKWESTNKQCVGTLRGSCASTTDKETNVKTAACQSISGVPCVEAKSCPFSPPPPPPPPPPPETSCGQHSKSASPPPATASTTVPAAASPPKPVLTTTTARKPTESVASEPKKVPPPTSDSKPTSPPAPPPKPKVSAPSPPKPSPPAATPTAPTAAAVCDAQSGGYSSKQSHSSSKGGSTSKSKFDSSTCKKLSMPGCAPPVRTSCVVNSRSSRKPCVKIPVPSPCFTDCYKGPCPHKMTNPCPLVYVSHFVECDIKDKNSYLQPCMPILRRRKKFVPPPPKVGIYIDPTLEACCESRKNSAPRASLL